MANPRFNKQTTQPRTKAMGGGMMRRDMKSGYYPSDMGMEGGAMYKKGGRVKKKKQAKSGHDYDCTACYLKERRRSKRWW